MRVMIVGCGFYDVIACRVLIGATLEVGLKSCVTKRALFYLLFKNENTVFSEVSFRLSSARRDQPGHTVLWVGPVLLWPMTSSKRSKPQSKV